MTRDEFAQVVSVIESGFGHKLSAEQQQVWFGTLEPMPFEAAKRAALAMCRDWPHSRRPWVSDLYRTAREYVQLEPATPASRYSLPEGVTCALGSGPLREPPPGEAVSIDAAVELVAEKIRGRHPDWKVGAMYSEVMRAIAGRGKWADAYAELRGRVRM